MDDWVEFALMIALAIGLAILSLFLIIATGWIVEKLFDMLTIEIDRTLYWTGVALLIPFAIFGKAKMKKED